MGRRHRRHRQDRPRHRGRTPLQRAGPLRRLRLRHRQAEHPQARRHRPTDSPARTLEDFLNETARTLGQPGIPKLAGEAKRRALLDALRDTRALLVYDNLETLSKAEQESIAVFLRALPSGCKAVITSRRRGGEGGFWLRLEKLDWDAAHLLILEEARKDSHPGSGFDSV